eukprot:1194999-Prorocentrum_minimum.AAC.1
MGLSQCGGDDGFTSAEVWVLVKSCDLSDLIPREVPFWDKEGLVRIKRNSKVMPVIPCPEILYPIIAQP